MNLKWGNRRTWKAAKQMYLRVAGGWARVYQLQRAHAASVQSNEFEPESESECESEK